MTTFRPFRAVRPAADLASSIAALPYDVYSSAEARRITEQEPLSFLRIDRAETQFPDAGSRTALFDRISTAPTDGRLHRLLKFRRNAGAAIQNARDRREGDPRLGRDFADGNFFHAVP